MDSMIDILLIEDEPDLGALLSLYLQNKGFRVSWKLTAESALQELAAISCRLVIIDVQLPDGDGFSVARRIKERVPLQPIFFLTALGGKENRKKGLELGAFDYIEKPFEMDELMLKIMNVIRFSATKDAVPSVKSSIRLGHIVVAPDRLLLTYPTGEKKSMTLREAEILTYLLEHKNELVLKKDLLLRFWGNTDYFNGKSLEVFISRIRKLLKVDPTVAIESIYGAGYILNVNK